MKKKRHAKILELIRTYPINTQEGLLEHLRAADFDVTQATISRDIRELRLVKVQGADGQYRYSTGKSSSSDVSSKFHALFPDSVNSIDYAGNIVAIKCMVGMAQAVCAALDSLHWDGTVGTIAGDDTIFILVRSESNAAAMVAELKKLML
ncbi:MAG: arginine repressor [Clostridia bacterium]|nr:arginine repressor [Clostridia bacterium]